MTLNELLKNQTQTGKLVQFSKGHGKNGLVIVVRDDLNKKYVLEKSLTDYERFDGWLGKKSRADIKQTGKFAKTEEYGRLPMIQIRIKSEEEDNTDVDLDHKNKEMVF